MTIATNGHISRHLPATTPTARSTSLTACCSRFRRRRLTSSTRPRTNSYACASMNRCAARSARPAVRLSKPPSTERSSLGARSSPPHKDVASGRYQQAEFAADLWQVHIGEGTDEYRKPVEFFRRTYLTESLKRLLVGAVQRLNGAGRRSGRAAPDQLRRRQDALDAGAVSSVLRHRSE